MRLRDLYLTLVVMLALGAMAIVAGWQTAKWIVGVVR